MKKKTITPLNLKQQIFLRYPNIKQHQQKLAIELKNKKELDSKILEVKLSAGSQRVPEKQIDYYLRGVSILFCLVENPVGIKKIAQYYTRMKTNSVKPPVKKPATSSLIKKYTTYLSSLGFLSHTQGKGYYTTKEGKEFITGI